MSAGKKRGAPAELDRRDRELHLHIRNRLLEALGDRSWNWLSEQIHVPQSTLSTQVTKPRFSLETVARAARVLRRPTSWFLPDGADLTVEAAAEAYYELESVVLFARESSATERSGADDRARRARAARNEVGPGKPGGHRKSSRG